MPCPAGCYGHAVRQETGANKHVPRSHMAELEPAVLTRSAPFHTACSHHCLIHALFALKGAAARSTRPSAAATTPSSAPSCPRPAAASTSRVQPWLISSRQSSHRHLPPAQPPGADHLRQGGRRQQLRAQSLTGAFPHLQRRRRRHRLRPRRHAPGAPLRRLRPKSKLGFTTSTRPRRSPPRSSSRTTPCSPPTPCSSTPAPPSCVMVDNEAIYGICRRSLDIERSWWTTRSSPP